MCVVKDFGVGCVDGESDFWIGVGIGVDFVVDYVLLFVLIDCLWDVGGVLGVLGKGVIYGVDSGCKNSLIIVKV